MLLVTNTLWKRENAGTGEGVERQKSKVESQRSKVIGRQNLWNRGTVELLKR